MHFVLIVIIFFWGLTIGSFLNVCIYRLPRQKSVVLPRSFCPSCQRTLAWYDNIPVLSYLLLGGKCRHCGAPISPRYALVELLNGALFVAVHFHVVNQGMNLLAVPFLWYFVASLIALSLIDWEHQIIPDKISYPLIAFGLIFAMVHPQHLGVPTLQLALIRAAKGLLVGGFSLLLIGVLGKTVFKKEAMGMGDVKLMAGVGAWQGHEMTLLAIFLGAFVAAVFGIGLILFRKARWSSRIPFGPYLAIGSLLSLFFGWRILFFYLSFCMR